MPPAPPAFRWLTGSPFILHDLGLSPADIGLSYMPQTVAFLAGGFGCRTALQRRSGRTLLPALLIFYAISVVSLFMVAMSGKATLWGLLAPFCGMALANGAIYPIVVANALLPFPQDTGKAAALQNCLQLGLCFSPAGRFRLAQPSVADHQRSDAVYRTACRAGLFSAADARGADGIRKRGLNAYTCAPPRAVIG